MMRNGVRCLLAAAAVACSTAVAAPQAATPQAGKPQQASRPDIVVGSHVDLTGPLSSWGTAVKNGLTMAMDEANAAGGVNGKKLRLVVRDDAYDPALAAKTVARLADEDGAFAILSPLGTPTVHAAMTEALSRGVLYLFPLSASEETYLPLAPLKFSLMPSHEMEVQEGLRRILNARGTSLKVGVLASNDAFGRAVKQAADNELGHRGMSLVAAADFSAGDASFETALDRLRRAGATLIVLGAEAEQALRITRSAAAIRWQPDFLCSSACYEPEFATLAGDDAEGMFGVGQVPIPYPEDAKLGPWMHRYEAKFHRTANVHALAAYRSARLFLTVLAQTGPSPTQARFATTLETRGSWTDQVLGGLPAEFSATDHLGSHTSLLAQIRKGRWVVLTDAGPAPPAKPK